MIHLIEIFLKSYSDERGFTFVEIIVSISIISILSILIYSIYGQAIQNYIIANRIYMATIDCQNILLELECQIDNNDGIYNKDLCEFQNLELKNLDTSRYSFKFDIVDFDKNSNLKFNDSSDFIPHISETEFQNISDNLYIDDRTESRFKVDFKTDISNLNIHIKNYTPNYINLNVYGYRSLECKAVNIISYSEYGKVKLNLFENVSDIYKSYIITVTVYDIRTNSILKQIVDLYSYVPEFN